jgi:HD-GYP domain-containing protein (c-di-GMP phosphodiesterase class II)
MASDRPYRAALSVDAILAELEAESGKRYDPLVVAALGRVLERKGSIIISNSADEVLTRTREPIHPVHVDPHGYALKPKTGAA